jgi:hypothetical protein
MGDQAKMSFRESALKWLLRFIKFNIVGFGVFLVGTVIFVFAFSSFGEWTWVISSGSGGLLQFFLISYLNTTKRGKIFESSEQRKQ